MSLTRIIFLVDRDIIIFFLLFLEITLSGDGREKIIFFIPGKKGKLIGVQFKIIVSFLWNYIRFISRVYLLCMCII